MISNLRRYILLALMCMPSLCGAQEGTRKVLPLVVGTYNVENLFDCEHDSLKEDTDFMPDGAYRWSRSRYWQKLNAVARGIVAMGGCNDNDDDALRYDDDNPLTGSGRVPDNGDEFRPADLVALTEVENDTVLTALTQRSLLRGARYEYVMTSSPDRRGVDVALLYQHFAFDVLSYYSLRVDALVEKNPTRDILYVKGRTNQGDTLHVFVVHAPSRRGGARESDKRRLLVAERLLASADSITIADGGEQNILVMGDFNDYVGGKSMKRYATHFVDISAKATGHRDSRRVRGTYRYQGEWGSLDHILVSKALLQRYTNKQCFVVDEEALLEEDDKYGGVRPKRFMRGPIHNPGGTSDHLPLVLQLRLKLKSEK